MSFYTDGSYKPTPGCFSGGLGKIKKLETYSNGLLKPGQHLIKNGNKLRNRTINSLKEYVQKAEQDTPSARSSNVYNKNIINIINQLNDYHESSMPIQITPTIRNLIIKLSEKGFSLFLEEAASSTVSVQDVSEVSKPMGPTVMPAVEHKTTTSVTPHKSVAKLVALMTSDITSPTIKDITGSYRIIGSVKPSTLFVSQIQVSTARSNLEPSLTINLNTGTGVMADFKMKVLVENAIKNGQYLIIPTPIGYKPLVDGLTIQEVIAAQYVVKLSDVSSPILEVEFERVVEPETPYPKGGDQLSSDSLNKWPELLDVYATRDSNTNWREDLSTLMRDTIEYSKESAALYSEASTTIEIADIMLERKNGHCFECSVLLYQLLKDAGQDCRIIGGYNLTADSLDSVGHFKVQYRSYSGEWVSLESTPPTVSLRYTSHEDTDAVASSAAAVSAAQVFESVSSASASSNVAAVDREELVEPMPPKLSEEEINNAQNEVIERLLAKIESELHIFVNDDISSVLSSYTISYVYVLAREALKELDRAMFKYKLLEIERTNPKVSQLDFDGKLPEKVRDIRVLTSLSDYIPMARDDGKTSFQSKARELEFGASLGPTSEPKTPAMKILVSFLTSDDFFKGEALK